MPESCVHCRDWGKEEPHSAHWPPRSTQVCISGAQADDDGVCTEHGETTCVIGLP